MPNIQIKWKRDTLTSDEIIPPPTDTAKMDTRSVYFCTTHNGCLLRDDVFVRKGKTRCRKHLIEVQDVTNAPMGHAFRQIVSPKPRK